MSNFNKKLHFSILPPSSAQYTVYWECFKRSHELTNHFDRYKPNFTGQSPVYGIDQKED